MLDVPPFRGPPPARRATALPAAQRLKIGLSACFSHADPARSLFTNKTLQYVEQSIAHWIMSAGAMVVMVPCPTGETARGDVTLAHYAEWLDGVVMHGGADVWPGSYGEVPLKDAWLGDRIRDLYDLAVVEAFEQAGKPIFGVCRGLQLINVAFGGTLYQDIETQHPGAQQHRNAVTYDQHFHEVEIVPGTRLSQLYPQQPRMVVNSIHHQGIKNLAPGFEIEAWSHPDGVPEAIRRNAHSGRGYIAATQWHPEFFKPGASQTMDDAPILHDFLAACIRAKSRPAPGHSPFRIRDRAARLLRQALLRR
ncbi:type 1 glutamine amidotransferase [Paracidovorax citrulli]|uniref:Peptidase C26 n=2 Tax=Paracidovorax citrulli TaxID=80869 RepID=A1TVZ6_PARC0|nr:type 1 glutamine amidotransferase [Paracidovorax citrulli]ABM35134.1 peptidase C26 [Paracidovorax citrulli AAC00-1]ATG96349.1 peptidase C26 [Paracidovorax citrulli]MVT29938.1 gamma-glutamyl-gamma-aminobutyrate hydrolase family protein [Paracidovorax citrulli]PVY64585.1 putative glutamine amidotransferase [Paracidovorax citrulli]QCX10486.1 Gamma-glutamyl-gamma-aminobutyrate hydrolase PuuD [Paracidovorax citrulli]